MRRAEKSQFSTAFHEAGHAVAAVVEGIRFRRVSIRPEAGSLGRIMLHKWPGWTTPDSPLYDDQRAWGWFEKRARISLAGQIAEQHYAKRLAPRYTHVGDDHDVVDFASQICGFKDERNAWIQYLCLGTRNRLLREPYWSPVRALARELMKQETIEEEEARRIIGSTLK